MEHRCVPQSRSEDVQLRSMLSRRMANNCRPLMLGPTAQCCSLTLHFKSADHLTQVDLACTHAALHVHATSV